MKQFVLLLIIVACLLVVGTVSHTVPRHLIQLIPVLVAAFLIQQGYAQANAFSLAIGLFWFTIMLFIWLFLLGIAKITKGHFTPTEIVMTIIIGMACLGIIFQVIMQKRVKSFVSHLLMFLVAFGLQIFFMWLSLDRHH